MASSFPPHRREFCARAPVVAKFGNANTAPRNPQPQTGLRGSPHFKPAGIPTHAPSGPLIGTGETGVARMRGKRRAQDRKPQPALSGRRPQRSISLNIDEGEVLP
jgi:hypothetical protein